MEQSEIIAPHPRPAHPSPRLPQKSTRPKGARLHTRVARLAMCPKHRLGRNARQLLKQLAGAHQDHAELFSPAEAFKEEWSQPNFLQASRHRRGFASPAKHSSVQAIKRFARRVNANADAIVNAIHISLASGAIEDFNRKMADLIRRGYGCKNLPCLSLKIKQLSEPRSNYLPAN